MTRLEEAERAGLQLSLVDGASLRNHCHTLDRPTLRSAWVLTGQPAPRLTQAALNWPRARSESVD